MNDDSDWKQYELLAQTMRHSLDLVLKLNISYYAVTGAILSFYFSRPAPVPWGLRFALVFPAVMAVVCSLICARAASTMTLADDELKAIAGRLKLGAWPAASPLRGALVASSVLLSLAAVLLAMLIIFADALHVPTNMPGRS